jgi:Zn-dependent protease with chaperone function
VPGADNSGQPAGDQRGNPQSPGGSSQGGAGGGGSNRRGGNRNRGSRGASQGGGGGAAKGAGRQNGNARGTGARSPAGKGGGQRTGGGQGQRPRTPQARNNVAGRSVASGTTPASARDLAPPSAIAKPAARKIGADAAERADRKGRVPGRGRALTVAAIPALVIAVLVIAVGAGVGQVLVGLVVAVVLGACAWAGVWFGASRLLLGRLGGRAVEDEDVPRASNLVDGLCATMGLPLPAMVLIDDPFRGALAIGRNERNATLVLTTGLLRALHPVELEGVLAHELSHIKSGDMASATMAATVVLPLAPLFSGSPELVRKLAGPGRELAADERAYAVTRYPPGLRDALVKMTAGPPPASPSTLASAGTGRVLRWVWTVVPELLAPGSTVGVLDAPATRVAALDEA